MKEVIVVAIVLFLYFIISYVVYNRLVKTKTIGFILITTSYLVFTYLLFLLMLRFAEYELTPSLYDDSIHVNEIMLAAFFVCTLTAFINIVAAIARIESEIKKRTKEDAKVISFAPKKNIANSPITAAQ